MRADPAARRALHDENLRRALRGTVVGLPLFALLGTVAAVWTNPFFVRMTPVGPWEFAATVLTALLAGITSALWIPTCRMRATGTGGIASFLGIACPTCNKVLMLIFGGPALLAWFDPIRPWLAAVGAAVMAVAATNTWRAFRELRRPSAVPEPAIDRRNREVE
jgi:hypothetical protein